MKHKVLFILFFIMAAAVPLCRASAATLYVDKQGLGGTCSDSYAYAENSESKPFCTIQRAADTVNAGDTVYVKKGTYYERVSIKKSGTAGNYITFAAYPGNEVVIDGENIRNQAILFSTYNSADYIKISGFILQNSAMYGIFAGEKSNIIIDGIESRNNKQGGLYFLHVSNATVRNSSFHNNIEDGMYFYTISHKAKNLLIENNSALNNGEDGIAVQSNGNYDSYPPGTNEWENVTIRNNDAGNNGNQGIWAQRVLYAHIYNNHCHDNGATGIQIETGSRHIVVEGNIAERNNRIFSGEYGIWYDETIYGVVQNNIMRENQGGFNATQSHNIIVRNNIIYNNKGQYNSASCAWCPSSTGGMSVGAGHTTHLGAPYGATNNVYAHNTVYDNGASASEWGNLRSFSDSAIKNNIFKNNILSRAGGIYDTGIKDPDVFSVNDYNIIYNIRPLLFKYAGIEYDLSGYKSASGWDSSSISANPLLAAPPNDFHLQSSSPAIDAGGFLTRTTSSGSGKTLVVQDARYFSDGYGVIPGDLVVVGSNSPVRITNVNYDTNTITLESGISWNNNDPVSYQYSGNRPDIGAYEFASVSPSDTTPPSPPNGLAIK